MASQLRIHWQYWLAMTLLCGAAVGGCKRISNRTLTDTEGRRFTAECDRNGVCKLSQIAGTPAPPGQPGVSLYSPGRMVGVCNVKASGHAPESPADCRALECVTDSDCPPQHGTKDGNCLGGLCTSPRNELQTADSVMMCLAGTGLGRADPKQVGLYAMALNCGNPCKIPKPCRQP